MVLSFLSFSCPTGSPRYHSNRNITPNPAQYFPPTHHTKLERGVSYSLNPCQAIENIAGGNRSQAHIGACLAHHIHRLVHFIFSSRNPFIAGLCLLSPWSCTIPPSDCPLRSISPVAFRHPSGRVGTPTLASERWTPVLAIEVRDSAVPQTHVLSSVRGASCAT